MEKEITDKYSSLSLINKLWIHGLITMQICQSYNPKAELKVLKSLIYDDFMKLSDDDLNSYKEQNGTFLQQSQIASIMVGSDVYLSGIQKKELSSGVYYNYLPILDEVIKDRATHTSSCVLM